MKIIEFYKLVIPNTAKQMLKKHKKFLAKVSVKASKNLEEEFYEGVRRIGENPYGYPYENDKTRYRRYLFYKRYLIIYLIEKDIIYIDYIVDVRQNYFKDILKS